MRYPVIHGQALVQYALFLDKIYRDYGARGKNYAEKAEGIAQSHQATAVMRNVARFYVQSAGNNCSKLNKAEAILKKILNSNPDGDYKGITYLANCLLKKYEVRPCADTFAEGEECFRKAWKLNKKYSTPALDLVRLYQTKYDKTKDVSSLVKAEKIFQELFLCYEGKEELDKAIICSAFGKFMKRYGRQLASFYLPTCPDYQGVLIRSKEIEEALRLTQQYEQDKQDEHLLQTEQVFRQLYNSLEELQSRDPVKARFHKEYAAFLDNFSNDLAFCYLTKSLEHNPHQGYAYKPLEELAKDKIASPDKKEQIKGHKAVERIAQLRER